MKKLIKYSNQINLALEKLESYHDLLKDAAENLELKKNMEERIVILEKEKSSSKELIDQAIEEIKQLRNNKINKTNIDG